MSAFNPTTRLIDPPLDADPLGAALLKSLKRYIGLGLSWPAWLTLVVGVVSLGIVPLVWQTRRFLHHAAVERTQWRHIAEWLESATGESMNRLRETTERQRAPNWIIVAIAISLIVSAACLGLLIATGPAQHAWQNILAISGWLAKRPGTTWGVVYTVSLTIGYALYYTLILRHTARMRTLVEDFNDLALDAATPPDEELGLRGAWILGAIAFALAGLPWGILMMLAGSSQRRYTTITSVRMRAAIAERLQEIREGTQ